MAEINRLVVEVDVSQLTSATAALQEYVKIAKQAADATKSTKTASGGTNKVKKDIDDNTAALERLVSLTARSTPEIDKQTQAVERQRRTVNGFIKDIRNSESAFGAFLRFGTELYLGMRAVETVFRAVGKVFGATYEAATSLESLNRALGALSGSLENGQVLVGFIGELSRTLPVSATALGEASKALMGYGFSMQEVVDILPTLSQITQNNADKMEGLAIVYGQVRSQGRAYYDDVRQFVTAGIPVVETLAKVLKIPVEDVRKAVREGKADIEVFDQALRMLTEEGSQFHNRLQAELDTTRGKVTLLKNEWKTFLQLLGDSRIPKFFVGAAETVVNKTNVSLLQKQVDFALIAAKSSNPKVQKQGLEDATRLAANYPDLFREAIKAKENDLDFQYLQLVNQAGKNAPTREEYDTSKGVLNQRADIAAMKQILIINEKKKSLPADDFAKKSPGEDAVTNFIKEMMLTSSYLDIMRRTSTKAEIEDARSGAASTREAEYKSTLKLIAALPKDEQKKYTDALGKEYQNWLKVFGPSKKESTTAKKDPATDILEDFTKQLRGATMQLAVDDDYEAFVKARVDAISKATERAFEEGFGTDSSLYKKIDAAGKENSTLVQASQKRYLAIMAPGRNDITERGTARFERYAGYDMGPFADIRTNLVDELTRAVQEANITEEFDVAIAKGSDVWKETFTQLITRGATEADVGAIRDVYVDIMKDVELAAYKIRAAANPVYSDAYSSRFGWQRTGGSGIVTTDQDVELRDLSNRWEAIFGEPIKNFTTAVSKFGATVSMYGKDYTVDQVQEMYTKARVSTQQARKEYDVTVQVVAPNLDKIGAPLKAKAIAEQKELVEFARKKLNTSSVLNAEGQTKEQVDAFNRRLSARETLLIEKYNDIDIPYQEILRDIAAGTTPITMDDLAASPGAKKRQELLDEITEVRKQNKRWEPVAGTGDATQRKDLEQLESLLARMENTPASEFAPKEASTPIAAARNKISLASYAGEEVEQVAAMLPLWEKLKNAADEVNEAEVEKIRLGTMWSVAQEKDLNNKKKMLDMLKTQSQVLSSMVKMTRDSAMNSAVEAMATFGTSLATGEGNPIETFARSMLNALPSILLAGAKSAFDSGMTGIGIALLLASGAVQIGAAYATATDPGSTTRKNGTFYENALGGVYGPTGYRAFAAGGAFTNRIVSSPTMFRYGGGFGVMGEAGEEGILPLTRVGGKLGVHATGGGGTVVQIIDQRTSGAAVDTQEETRGDGTKVITAIIRDAVRKTIASGEQDSAFRRFGLAPVGARRM